MEFNIEKLVRKNILNIRPYVSFRDENRFEDAVFLDANENPFGSYNRYPDSTQRNLKAKLADLKKVDADQISIGNGSDELIDVIIRTFCEPKQDSILVMNPSFSMYRFYADINENKVIETALDEDFQIIKDEFSQLIKENSPKIFFICSPNNPTGNLIENIEYFLENFKGIVVVDEAYIDFSGKDSAVKLLSKYQNLIVLQTFSKAWGMAAARVGAAYASPEITQMINKVKSPYNVSSLSLSLVSDALDADHFLQKNVDEILAEKSWLEAQLKNLKSLKKVFPSDANFFLTEFSDAENVFRELRSNKILTSKRTPQIPDCLRITVGSRSENEKLINVLKEL